MATKNLTASERLARVLDLIECVDEDSANYRILREARNLLKEGLA